MYPYRRENRIDTALSFSLTESETLQMIMRVLLLIFPKVGTCKNI
jgi:hypothetical protein